VSIRHSSAGHKAAGSQVLQAEKMGSNRIFKENGVEPNFYVYVAAQITGY
jgi:hypothetical protein